MSLSLFWETVGRYFSLLFITLLFAGKSLSVEEVAELFFSLQNDPNESDIGRHVSECDEEIITALAPAEQGDSGDEPSTSTGRKR